MTLRELVAKIGFQIEHEKLSRLDSQLNGIKNRLNLMIGAEAIRGLYHLAERFSQLGEQLKIAAMSAGVSTDEFQKLSFAAQQSGASQEELSRSLFILSQRLYAAKKGSGEAQKAFSEAGISGDQLSSFKSADQALLALSNTLRNKEPYERNALMRELLGRGSMKMVEFMNQGSKAIKEQGEEAVRLGLIISGPQIKALKDLKDTFEKLSAVFRAVSAIIAAKISPVFKLMIDDFLKLFGANKKIIDLAIDAWLMKMARAMGYAVGFIEILIYYSKALWNALHLSPRFIEIILLSAGVVLSLIKLGEVIKWITGIQWALVAATSAEFIQLTLLGAIVAGLILLVHDFYKVLSGEPTWIEAFEQWLGILKPINETIDWIWDKWEKLSSGLGKAANWLGPFMGLRTGEEYGMDRAKERRQRLTEAMSPAASAIGSPANALSSVVTNASTVGGSNVSVNAPMTFNQVPPGTRPEDVGPYVKNAIREHFDRTNREAARSLGVND